MAKKLFVILSIHRNRERSKTRKSANETSVSGETKSPEPENLR